MVKSGEEWLRMVKRSNYFLHFLHEQFIRLHILQLGLQLHFPFFFILQEDERLLFRLFSRFVARVLRDFRRLVLPPVYTCGKRVTSFK